MAAVLGMRPTFRDVWHLKALGWGIRSVHGCFSCLACFPAAWGSPEVRMLLQACGGQKAAIVGALGCGQWAWWGVLWEGTGTPTLSPQVLGHQAGMSRG